MIGYGLKILVQPSLPCGFRKAQLSLAELVASLPLTPLLAFGWMHYEKSPETTIRNLSILIFWLVIPSLALYALFWWLLQHNMSVWMSLEFSCAATAGRSSNIKIPFSRSLNQLPSFATNSVRSQRARNIGLEHWLLNMRRSPNSPNLGVAFSALSEY
jgi:hypothetical protein